MIFGNKVLAFIVKCREFKCRTNFTVVGANFTVVGANFTARNARFGF